MLFKKKEFKDIKNIVDGKTMLLFPIYNVPFDVHNDASDCQTGVVSLKYQISAALFSTKLTDTKKRCTAKKEETNYYCGYS